MAAKKKRQKASPRCLLIAGPNGAGKTTFAREYLPKDARVLNFVNADLIAAGLSPIDPMALTGRTFCGASREAGSPEHISTACGRLGCVRQLESTTETDRIRTMKAKRPSQTLNRNPAFAAPVERALIRAERAARRAARLHGTPIYVWENGKVVAKRP